jgi:hypothetical protein
MVKQQFGHGIPHFEDKAVRLKMLPEGRTFRASSMVFQSRHLKLIALTPRSIVVPCNGWGSALFEAEKTF